MKTSLRPMTALLGTVVAGLLVFAGPAQGVVTFDSSFSGPGSGAGQLANPSDVAVNWTTGDVYVADSGNRRVDQFDTDGNFIRAWGENVNLDTGGDICTAASGDTCQPGDAGGGGGQFSAHLGGIAVDNSTGPAAGSVYVQDFENNRIQRFTADGVFVLTWGKEVNLDTGGHICTAASGDTCKSGNTSGQEPNDQVTPPIPEIPSEPGQFAGWCSGSGCFGSALTVDGEGYIYVGDSNAVPRARVQKFDAAGSFVGQIAPSGAQIAFVLDLAADRDGDLYLLDNIPKRFAAEDFGPSGSDILHDATYGHFGQGSSGSLPNVIAVDPLTEFPLVARDSQDGCDATSGSFIAEYHVRGERVDCTDQLTPPISLRGGNSFGLAWTGMVVSDDGRLYVTDDVADKVHVFNVPAPEAPSVGSQAATDVTLRSAVIKAPVSGNLADTQVRVEVGTSPCSSNACTTTVDYEDIGASLTPRPASVYVSGLEPDTKYFYRVAATNSQGTEYGADRSFSTYPDQVFDQSCPNVLARQQTGSAFLLDCRGYELVSAADSGGYDVVSSLVTGLTPFSGYPRAGDKALYSVRDGGIPGTGKPTNRGPDPYIATRDAGEERWKTEYVGIPADAPSASPFSSTVASADSSLETFAFGGPEICNPCFGDGSAGMPIRLPDGSIVQGMAGSIPVGFPEPAGEVLKSLSGDGSHFIFGSRQQFEPAGNDTGTDVTIYDRNLESGTTQVVSTLPDGSTIQNGDEVVALDVSQDGSRILIGSRVSTDSAGNDYFDLYMHVGSDPESLEIADTASGVQLSGMTEDGSQVLFTSKEQIAGDGDSSADLFRATVGGGTVVVEWVSAGSGGAGDTDSCDPTANSFSTEDWNALPGESTDCSVLAIGGGGGIAPESGAAYFLSPENLDGNGTEGAPNLYVARPASEPEFIASLESTGNTPFPETTHPEDGTFGPYVTPVGAAIDRQDGSTYVLDLRNASPFAPGTSGLIQKFDESGVSDTNFDGDSIKTGIGALADASPFGLPHGFPLQIAVDNSTEASAGTLWVPQFGFGGASTVEKFDPSGASLGSYPAPGIPVGIAVNPVNGNVYVLELFSGSVMVFNSNGESVAPGSFSVNAFDRGIAIDSSGRVYVAGGASTRIYDGSTGAPIGVLDPSSAFGVAVDLADDHVYVDRGNAVVEYDSSGVQVGAPFGSGVLSGSFSLAADSGRLVVSNRGSSNFTIFGPISIPPDSAYDHPLVINSLRDADERRSADFQVTPSGNHALFTSTLPLSGVDAMGHYQVFRFDALSNTVDCVSCSPTEVDPTTDAAISANGLSITDAGEVFFDTGESLVLRDANSRRDAYEWSDGKAELISSGQSPFDSGLLSVSASGKDAFFFTRERLVLDDKNGNLVKLYTAREQGGFFKIPPPPPCAASDECHGAGSTPPQPLAIRTLEGSDGDVTPPIAKRCSTRQVKALGRRAKSLTRRSKALRRRANSADSTQAARRLRRESRRAASAARSNSRKAQRCRAQTRRTK